MRKASRGLSDAAVVGWAPVGASGGEGPVEGGGGRRRARWGGHHGRAGSEYLRCGGGGLERGVQARLWCRRAREGCDTGRASDRCRVEDLVACTWATLVGEGRTRMRAAVGGCWPESDRAGDPRPEPSGSLSLTLSEEEESPGRSRSRPPSVVDAIVHRKGDGHGSGEHAPSGPIPCLPHPSLYNHH